MSAKVDLYTNSYGNYERDVYRDVRVETYGADFGQTSWVNTEESHETPHLLDLTPGCSVLEIGSLCAVGGRDRPLAGGGSRRECGRHA